MTNKEYQSLTQFTGLPLYDDDDSRCETIDRVNHDMDFTGEVLEADDLILANDYIRQGDLVPKGGIRHHGHGGSTIFAYFWRKR